MIWIASKDASQPENPSLLRKRIEREQSKLIACFNVLGVRDEIVMKTIAGRTQDLADIEALREVGDG